MRRCEHLALLGKQPFANFKGQFEMVERIKLIDKDKGGIPHAFHPKIKQPKMSGSCGYYQIKENLFFINDTEEILISWVRGGELKILPAHVQQEPPEIINQFVANYVLI
jgi:hypothetical protein